jgi:hypothetical protein
MYNSKSKARQNVKKKGKFTKTVKVMRHDNDIQKHGAGAGAGDYDDYDF